MIARVKVRPVLLACAGCPEYGNAACEVARELDRLGLAEASFLGRGEDEGVLAAKARERYPVYTLEGCAKLCAGAWLARHGMRPQSETVLSAADAADPASAARRIAAGW
jgi:uncharacterized metal-binding protein